MADGNLIGRSQGSEKVIKSRIEGSLFEYGRWGCSKTCSVWHSSVKPLEIEKTWKKPIVNILGYVMYI